MTLQKSENDINEAEIDNDDTIELAELIIEITLLSLSEIKDFVKEIQDSHNSFYVPKKECVCRTDRWTLFDGSEHSIYCPLKT